MEAFRTVWRKSSHSGEVSCVETAALAGQAAVRDSKDPYGPVLTFSPAAWITFLTDLKTGGGHRA
jgi:hypothetical protein